jgi:hypothetical protein
MNTRSRSSRVSVRRETVEGTEPPGWIMHVIAEVSPALRIYYISLPRKEFLAFIYRVA